MIPNETIEQYDASGVVLLDGCFCRWLSMLRAGVEGTLNSPGPYYSEHVGDESGGRFVEEYLCWRRIREYRNFLFESNIGYLAAKLMRSSKCQLLYDHTFVKEKGTLKRTPWHQDLPYSPIVGEQSINVWIALDDVAAEESLHFVPSSHKSHDVLEPQSFDTGRPYSATTKGSPDCFVLDASATLRWNLLAGDALFFSSRVVHGTCERRPLRNRRRAFCARLIGNDIRYCTKVGIPSFPWIDLVDGQEMPAELFPTIYVQPL